MTRGQGLAVIVTCLVAAMTYAGAVTMDGMGLYVLPAVAGAALFGSFLAARRMSGTALVVGGALVLGWSELVNIWSGNGAGPAARSTAVAAFCTLLAVVVARSDSPALFLVLIAASVCGALLLGAGSEVRSVAVAAVVCAALTLGWIERSRRRWTATWRRGPALLLLSLLAGAVAAGAVLLQVQHDSRPPEAMAAGRAYPRIKPPWKDPLGMPEPRSRPSSPLSRAASSPPRHGTFPPPHNRQRPPHQPRQSPRTGPRTAPATHGKPAVSHSRVRLYVLAGILLFLLLVALALAARLLVVRLAWRRVRRRLATGTEAERVTGAWAWTRLRLEACRMPLPAAVSPDLLSAGRVPEGLHAEVLAPLRRVAAWTTAAAFANEPLAPADAFAAWKFAGRAEESARELLPRRARVRLAFRGPAAKAVTG